MHKSDSNPFGSPHKFPPKGPKKPGKYDPGYALPNPHHFPGKKPPGDGGAPAPMGLTLSRSGSGGGGKKPPGGGGGATGSAGQGQRQRIRVAAESESPKVKGEKIGKVLRGLVKGKLRSPAEYAPGEFDNANHGTAPLPQYDITVKEDAAAISAQIAEALEVFNIDEAQHRLIPKGNGIFDVVHKKTGNLLGGIKKKPDGKWRAFNSGGGLGHHDNQQQAALRVAADARHEAPGPMRKGKHGRYWGEKHEDALPTASILRESIVSAATLRDLSE